MLAERLPGLLPPLTPQEALEVTAVHSVAGILPPGKPLVDTAPYCAPHHSATMPSLVGGGSGLPRPGAVSLAHRGVLFLDEAPEFSAQALDALRQPLESGHVVIARAAGVDAAARPVPAGPGGEPLPVRPARDARRRAATARRPRCGATRPGCPDRCSTGSTCGSRSRPVTRAELIGHGGAGESTAVGRRPGPRGQGPGRRPVPRTRPGAPTARCPATNCAPAGGWRPAPCATPNATWSADCSPPADSTGCCGSPGRSPTSPATTCPDLDDVGQALQLRTGVYRGVPVGAGSAV